MVIARSHRRDLDRCPLLPQHPADQAAQGGGEGRTNTSGLPMRLLPLLLWYGCVHCLSQLKTTANESLHVYSQPGLRVHPLLHGLLL